MRTRTAAALALAGGLVAVALLTASGVVSVAASSGHWPAMDWFLHYAARRSVGHHAKGIAVPALGDPAQLRLGARHYLGQCAGCHGTPAAAPLPVMQRMTPPAPDLRDQVARWSAAELFWIVRHGIKYTAMPAWTSPLRDDEIWPVVAFLQALPTLDEAGYAALVGPIAEEGRWLERSVAGCEACHSLRDAAVPMLRGQSETYLRDSLAAYAAGERQSGIMQPLAAPLDAARRAELAAHYARLPPAARALPSDRGDTRRGARLAEHGDPVRSLPACRACHEPAGLAADPRHPRLSGQSAAYLRLQLRLFRDNRRGGGVAAPVMAEISRRLDEADIDDLAAYFAARPTPALSAHSSPPEEHAPPP